MEWWVSSPKSPWRGVWRRHCASQRLATIASDIATAAARRRAVGHGQPPPGEMFAAYAEDDPCFKIGSAPCPIERSAACRDGRGCRRAGAFASPRSRAWQWRRHISAAAWGTPCSNSPPPDTRRLDVLRVGTGDSPLTVPFYEACGFTRSRVLPNFFIDNYDHPHRRSRSSAEGHGHT